MASIIGVVKSVSDKNAKVVNNLTKEERGLIHGNDERIRLDEFKRTLAFFVRIMNKF